MMFCFPFRNAVTGMIVCNVSQNKRGVDFLQNFHHRVWGLVPKASFWLQIESKRLGADGRQQAANCSKRCCGGLSFSWLFSAVVGKNFFHFFSFSFFMAIQSNPWKMTQLLLACYVLPVRLEDWTNIFTFASCWTNSSKIVTCCTTLLAGNYTKYLNFFISRFWDQSSSFWAK